MPLEFLRKKKIKKNCDSFGWKIYTPSNNYEGCERASECLNHF